MSESVGLRLNTPLVAFQEIEGEAILINFDSGCYFSANQTGSILLELSESGASMSDLTSALASRCGVEEGEVADSVRAFLDLAESEALVVRCEPSGSPATGSQHPAVPFVKPALERFDDLQDLLMLDPIHDVDQVGWPMQAPAGTATDGDGTA